MSIIVTIHVEHERLALVPTLERLDGVDIEVVTQGTTDPGSSEFPFLVDYDDRGALERALNDDPTINEYKLVEWTGEGGVYYIEHTPETKLISTAVSDANGFLIHTESKRNGWLVRLLLPDRAALSTVWEHARENGMRLDIVEIHDNETTDSGPSYGLTDEQRTTLLTAYEEGYFLEPREMSLDELADELGLSSTAVSGRLRRGMRNLVAATIATEGPEQ
ncbi:DNA-binding protein [Halorubrum sp. BOL3-1]|uniref:helix-turn-helix domain-containing protein n=1 Tax=Halorubrum sp. BOL3-1 TaxID=2497325 RepID=UPI0010051FCD|nr:helix-turn-helix domain-containing protein [Halorubrum sp. BOL3-1]QAU13981.1 DNA-binding protein [Halorubrum sp. BOL3-1]